MTTSVKALPAILRIVLSEMINEKKVDFDKVERPCLSKPYLSGDYCIPLSRIKLLFMTVSYHLLHMHVLNIGSE